MSDSDNSSCTDQHFAELCSNCGVVISDRWILRVPSSGCNLVYAVPLSTTSEDQQTISINDCLVVYECWFVPEFENASVCLYHRLPNSIPAEPNEQLYLALLVVQKERWILQSHQSVFTYRRYTGTTSYSVDLYGTRNIESDSRAAVFLIGKDRIVYRVKLLFLEPAERRFTTVCEQHHKVVHISSTDHDVLVVCDNGVYWIKIGEWKSVEITPQELNNMRFIGPSVSSFMSESSNISVGLIAVGIAGNFEYCFIGLQSRHPLERCGIIPNVSLTHGMLVTRNNIFDTQFLALLNESTLVMIHISSSNPYITINVDFCNPLRSCYLLQTNTKLYVGNQWRTMVLDRETVTVITIQNASVHEVVEDALRHPEELPSSSTNPPINTIAPTATMVDKNPVITSSSITTTSIISSSSTPAVEYVTASTSETTPSTDVTATPVSVDVTTPTATSTSLKTSITTTTETTPSNDDAVSNKTAIGIDAKSKFIIVIMAVIVVVLVVMILIVIMVLVRKCRYSYNKLFKLNYQEQIKRNLQDKKLPCKTAQSESNCSNPGSEGEVVMSSIDTAMYSVVTTTLPTTTASVTQQTTRTSGIGRKVQVNNT